MYLWHLRPPPQIWRTSPDLKKTSAAPPSARDGVDLHRAFLGRRWSRPLPHLPRSEMEYICVTAADVETGMGDVVLGGDRNKER
jgi:hypothetical protein